MRKSAPRAVGVELVQDISAISSPTQGFLRRHRHRVKTTLDDSTRTEVYSADFIDRDPSRRDAVAVGIYAHEPGRPVEEALVLLRRQVRYAAFLVTGRALVTEVVAGILEAPESPEAAAAREVWEEAGLEVEPGEVERLGLPYFVLPGTITERIHPLAVRLGADELQAAPQLAPDGDGHPMEEGAEMICLTLGEAFTRMNRDPRADESAIADAKTELLLRRLRDRLRGER